VAPGVVLNKDGSFQRTARFRGADLDSATPGELDAAAGRMNAILRRLGSGWAVFAEAQRRPSQSYPTSLFGDPLSQLVDEERRAAFEAAGAHFESRYYLTFLYLPPPERQARLARWLFEGRSAPKAEWREILAAFRGHTDRLLDQLEACASEVA